MSKILNVGMLKLAGVSTGAVLLANINKAWGQRFLYDNLKKYPGVPAKFSQWLEQKWDLTTEFTKPLMTVARVREILADEAPGFLEQVSDISEEAFVASIGQVHRVTLLDGRTVALKVQYPGLAQEVVTQIDQMVWMMEKSPASRYGFDANSWRVDLQTMFGDELDYRGELLRQQKFADQVGDSGWVLVPKVFPQWSTQRILVQEYLPGVGLEKLLMETSEVRSNVACALARLFIRSLLSMPLVHGDLQPKNWAWCSQQQKLILYDYGSCVDWPCKRQRIFEALVDNIKSNRETAPIDYLVALGFDRKKLLSINSQLPALVESLLEPFWDSRLPSLSHWQVQKATQEILGEQSWYFRTAGPPWFLWLMRSCTSVFYALRELADRVPVAAIFAEEQARLQKSRWDGFGVPSQREFIEQEAGVWLHFSDQSRFLHIQVTEGVEEIVGMRFPIHALQNLENLIDPELTAKIKDQNLDINEIKTRAFRSGLVKQDLFNLKKGKRVVRVWIA
jgi:predicted unusual protein kinase regulating ubiquinone biosynthesis (AarF/ABC1/UbiB family)